MRIVVGYAGCDIVAWPNEPLRAKIPLGVGNALNDVQICFHLHQLLNY